ENVHFGNNNLDTGTLVIASGTTFTGTVSGFAAAGVNSDGIDFKGIHFASLTHNFIAATGQLTVSDGTNSDTFVLSGFAGTLHFNDDGSGGTLITDPPADSTPLQVDGGAITEVTSASAQNVTFTNASGSAGNLVLDDSSHFTGQITGFAGDGTPANSDSIDLRDITFANLKTASYLNNADSNGGTLTLSDGQHTTDLHFVGSYELANFKLSSDGYGGTLLIDPPVSAQQSESGAAYTDITGHSLPGFAREDS